jgi:large subunit ribosomal protein L15
VPVAALTAKLIKSGELSRKVALKGVKVSKGAREAVTAAGGSVAE